MIYIKVVRLSPGSPPSTPAARSTFMAWTFLSHGQVLVSVAHNWNAWWLIAAKWHRCLWTLLCICCKRHRLTAITTSLCPLCCMTLSRLRPCQCAGTPQACVRLRQMMDSISQMTMGTPGFPWSTIPTSPKRRLAWASHGQPGWAQGMVGQAPLQVQAHLNGQPHLQGQAQDLTSEGGSCAKAKAKSKGQSQGQAQVRCCSQGQAKGRMNWYGQQGKEGCYTLVTPDQVHQQVSHKVVSPDKFSQP